MKKVYYLLATILGPIGAMAQQVELIATTQYGGIDGAGVIFKTNGTTANQTLLYNFVVSNKASYSYNNGYSYSNGLVEANGKFYGMSPSGGYKNLGVIYEYDPASTQYTVKYQFSDTLPNTANNKGYLPLGGLMKADNGKLYGLTSKGGTKSGVLFEFDPTTGSYTKKVEFAEDGPYGTLMQANNGKLYGITNGGSYTKGGLFEYDITSNALSFVYNFTANDGYNNYGALIQAANGKLYGLSTDLGMPVSSGGLIYEFDIATKTFTKKFNLNSSTGTQPKGAFVEASNGKLYATTSSTSGNYGTLIEYDIANNTCTAVVKGSTSKGFLVSSTPTATSDGKIIGLISYYGGTKYGGGIFQFDPSTGVYSQVIDVNITDSYYNHFGQLLKASNGKYYGLCANASNASDGGLMEYDLSNNSYKALFTFNAKAQGANPKGNLCRHSNGKYYGTTSKGGAFGQGVIFEYDPMSNVLTKKFDFKAAASTGVFPAGDLTEGGNGLLYGNIIDGGAYQSGGIYSFDPSSSAFKLEASFQTAGKTAVPYSPMGALTKALNGKLYGLATGGGTAGWGMLYEFDPATSSITGKVSFDNSTNGYMDNKNYGKLLLASNGLLYGTNSTYLFSYNVGTTTLTPLLNMTASGNGNPGTDNPVGSIVEKNGYIYGALGVNSWIAAYRYEISTGNVLFKTNTTGDANGMNGGVCLGSDGKLYLLSMGLASNSLKGGKAFTIDENTLVMSAFLSIGGLKGDKALGTFTELSSVVTAVSDEQSNLTKDMISIAPNPNQGQFVLHVDPSFEQAQLMISDATGKVWVQKALNGSGNTIQESLPSGLYLLHLSKPNGQQAIQKIRVE